MSYKLSKENKEQLKEIGLTIKKRREALSYSLRKVSDITRINANELRSIEQGEYDNFPNVVFLRGFVRNYCRLLDLDCQWMIEVLNNIYEQHSDDTVENKQNISKSSNVNYFFYIGGAIVVMAAIFYFAVTNFNFQGNLPTPTVVKLEDPAAEATQAVLPIIGLQVELLGKSRGWVRVAIDQQEPSDMSVMPDKKIVFKADKNIQLVMSRGDLADIIVNNKPQPIPAEAFNRLYRTTIDIN